MRHKWLTLLFTLLALLIVSPPAAAEEPSTVSNLMSLLKEERQKAVYNVNLNAPFSKESSGINEKISSETGELSILQTILELPGRNSMDLILQAEYCSRDAGLFNEATRSAARPNNYGQTVLAQYDVFDRNGYWLKTGGLLIPAGQTIPAEYWYEQERWIFNGYLFYSTGGSLGTAEGIANAIEEKSKTSNGRYLLGAGWAIRLPYLDVDEDSVFVHLQNGATYKADFNSGNGLEKYELKDLLFDKYASFHASSEAAAYRLYYQDGKELFFSANGLLIGQRDRRQNTIRYYYEEISGLKALTEIEDTVGRKVRLAYSDSGAVISSGAKRVTLVKLPIPGQNGKYCLAGLVDAAGREITYRYSFDTAEFDMAGNKPPARNTYANLVEISYPTGARTVYSYTRGRKNLGRSGNMEYFKIRERCDRDGPRIVNRLTYRYFNEPDGYPAYQADRVPDGYRYETQTQNSKDLTTRHVFNGGHLPVTTRMAGTRLLSETRTRYHHRYRMPVEVRQRQFNAAGRAQEKVDFYDYDSRGNVIMENHPAGAGADTSAERKVYYAYDARYNHLISTRSKQDADTNVESKFALTPDGKEVVSAASYVNGSLMSQQSYSYDVYGNVISATARQTEAQNVTTTFEYGSEYNHAYLTAKNTATRDADGHTSTITLRYAYDLASGDKTSASDGNGNVTSFKYDLLGRLVESANPDNTTRRYEYDDAGNIACFTDENKNQTVYHFDGLGKLTRVREKQQNIDLVQIKYDDQENILQKTDPNGNYIEYSYDQFNRLIKVSHRDSRGGKLAETGVQYDEAFQDRAGALQKITVGKAGGPGQKDLVINYYYNNRGLLVQQGRLQDGKEYFAAFGYDYLDNLIEEADYEGNRTKYTFDGLGQLVRRTNALGQSKEYTYDYLGNLVAQTDELGHTIRTGYDALGRVIISRAPFEAGKERIIKNYYDAAGNTTCTVDPEGGVTRYRYNSRNLLTAVEKVLNARESNFVQYQYDPKGNRTGVATGLSAPHAPARAQTRFAYDSLDRIISYTDPAGQQETYRYDAGGNLLSSTDRNGRTCHYTYNGLGRVLKKQIIYNGRPETVEYSYDLLGNCTRMKDARGVTSYAYDSLSRLSKIRRDNGISLAYAYDILDRRVSLTLSQSTDQLIDIQYTYDNLGLLTRVREQGRAVRYNYDPAGRLTAAVDEVTGITTDYNYNQGGMLTGLFNRQGDEVLSNYTYAYDRRGNQTGKIDPNGTSLYQYDALSRLKTAVLPGNLTQHYTYDNLGNLTELLENQAGRIKETAYHYNRNSQLLLQEEREGDETTRCLFTYDANGNQTEKSKLTYRSGSLVATANAGYSYDDWNRLRAVTTPEGRRVRYDYDGNGLRAAKDIDGEITNFTYDGGNLLLETDGGGLPKAKNLYGRGLISRQTAQEDYYYLFNGHGDVTQLLNRRGEILKDYDYDPFGKARPDQPQLIPGQLPVSLWRAEVEQPDNPFRYAGEYLDRETGCYYLQARYYDPGIQRFISGDSLAKSPGWTEHSYAYVNYNPVNYIDPSGQYSREYIQSVYDWYSSAAAAHTEYMQGVYDGYHSAAAAYQESLHRICASNWYNWYTYSGGAVGTSSIKPVSKGTGNNNIVTTKLSEADGFDKISEGAMGYYGGCGPVATKEFAEIILASVNFNASPLNPRKLYEDLWWKAINQLQVLRTPDYYTATICVETHIGGFSLSPGAYTYDYYGNLYKVTTAGVGLGTLAEADVISGWIWTKERPWEKDLKDFLEGDSISVALGSYGIGGGLTFVNGKTAVELGAMTPRGEFTSSHSELIGKVTWEGIKPVIRPS